MKKLIFIAIIPLIFFMYGCDRVPEFKSTPSTTAYEGSEYTYEVKAEDPDGKSVSFFLVEGPEGMVLTKENVIRWTPAASDYGDHTIKIKADDSAKFTIQEYILSVHYQIVGKISFLNYSDESLYANAGITVNISGGSISKSAVSGSDGIFTLSDVPPGEYRYDIVSPDPMAWTMTSSERNINFIYPARIWWGNASIVGTLSSNTTGTRTLSLTANSRTVNLSSGTYTFYLDGLYPTLIESLIAKQSKVDERSASGLRVTSMYPFSYAYIYPVYLWDGVLAEYDISLTERDELIRQLWFVVDGQSYKLEKYGYVRMANTSFQLDLSTYTSIQNWGNPQAPIPAQQRYVSFYVGYGQNHDISYLWYGASGWSPYRAYNFATGEKMDFDMGYPLYPSVASGTAVTETSPMGLMRGDEPANPLLKEDSGLELGSVEPPKKIETTYNVIKGVGLTPTFRWWGPNAATANPQIYVVTVGEVNSSNDLIRYVWKGMSQQGEISFPNLTTPLLESGKRYVFYVTAYCGESATVTQNNVLWYPQDMNYWFSRSEGVIFEP